MTQVIFWSNKPSTLAELLRIYTCMSSALYPIQRHLAGTNGSKVWAISRELTYPARNTEIFRFPEGNRPEIWPPKHGRDSFWHPNLSKKKRWSFPTRISGKPIGGEGYVPSSSSFPFHLTQKIQLSNSSGCILEYFGCQNPPDLNLVGHFCQNLWVGFEVRWGPLIRLKCKVLGAIA